MSRRATSSLVVLVGSFTLAACVVLAHGPAPNPFVARFQASKLDVVTGDVPAYYSKGVARDSVASLAQRLDACRSLYPEAGRPAFALAVLNAGDWPLPSRNLMPRAIGPMPGVEPPFVILVADSFREVSPRVAGVRDLIAKAVGEANVDRFVHLLAVHELGHVIAAGVWESARAGVLGPKDAQSQTAQSQTAGQMPKHFPGWYNEFVANYFAANCNASQPDDAALMRRFDATAPVPGQKYTMLDDLDRLMADGRGTGQPYFGTPEGVRNYVAYEALTGEMANRLRDARFDPPRMIQLFRQQVTRPGPQSTDDLVKDLTGGAPGLYEWLLKAGAVQPPQKR